MKDSKKILIIDDSITMLKTIEHSFQKINEFNLVLEKDPINAMQYINFNEDIDLLVVDWNMPKMTGIDIIKEVRKMPKYKYLPIIMITTEGTKASVEEAIKLGVNGYIIKPFTFNIFKYEIEKIFTFF